MRLKPEQVEAGSPHMSERGAIGPNAVAIYRALVLRGALKMEVKGIKRRGRSAYAIVKEEYGYKGKKASVLAQLETEYRRLGILHPGGGMRPALSPAELEEVYELARELFARDTTNGGDLIL